MAKCRQCGKEYEHKRSTSAYCSPKCRNRFYRNRLSASTATLTTDCNAKPATLTGAPKRGKDIKVFEDLPLDVQQTIDRMSTVDGKIDQAIKANRTAIAIHYQHIFPDRFESKGVA